jgi:deoxyribonuclease IV
VNRVGLHVRVAESLVSVAQHAIDLSLPFFQSFVLLQVNKKAVVPSEEEIRAFRTLCEPHFTRLFAHGSFWLNLAGSHRYSVRSLQREVVLAKALGFTHLVVHPGHIQDRWSKEEAIYAIARTINTVMRYEQDLILVLENTAHGKNSIGSDLADFIELRKQLYYPERVLFCIDTAHAHAYGYALYTRAEVDTFILFLHEVLGLENIALLHLNDACAAHGSKIDEHAVLGEGLLGQVGLERFASHDALKHVPIILELPTDASDIVARSLHRAHTWCGDVRSACR